MATTTENPYIAAVAQLPHYLPPWATSLGEDRFGIYAELEVAGEALVLRWIPPGRFLMGSPEDEEWQWVGIQHPVTISQGYWLGETPVTQAQWQAVMGDNPSEFKGKQRPVEQVSFVDSEKLLARINDQFVSLGLRFALPSEAQWEYACRAGTQAAFNNGAACTKPEGRDPALDQLGWFNKNSGGKTQPVKGKQANAWGLYDMHGNVWEWCADAWSDYKVGAQVDPFRPGQPEDLRAARGGAWLNQARYCRAACRGHDVPFRRWYNRGLRLAAGQPPEAAE